MFPETNRKTGMQMPVIPGPAFWVLLAAAFFLAAVYYRLFPPEWGINSVSGTIARLTWTVLLIASGILLPVWEKWFLLLFSSGLLVARLFYFTVSPGDITETAVTVLAGSMALIFQVLLDKERNKVRVTLERLEVYRENVSRQIRATMERETQLSLIISFSDQLSLSQDLLHIMKTAAEMVKSITRCRCVLIFSTNRDMLSYVTGKGVDNFPDNLKTISIEGRAWQAAIDSRRPVQVKSEDLGTEWHWAQDYVIIPLSAPKQVMGLMVVGYHHQHIDQSKLDLFLSLGNLLGVAAENVHLMTESLAGIAREREMQENLRYYLQQITRAQEEERLRMSRDLHDSTAQSLIAAIRHLEHFIASHQQLSMADTRSLWEIRERLKSVLQEVRQFSGDLRPSILDDLGLLPAVDWLLQQMKQNYSIKGHLEIKGKERRFYPEVELTLFRIIQEALRNITKHAGATAVRVELDFRGDNTLITISDNGKGFALDVMPSQLPRSGKLGLVGMQERARLIQGRLEIDSSPGQGSTIRVIFPSHQNLASDLKN